MADPTSEPVKRFLVVIDPDADIDEVASDLQAAGAAVHEKLEFIGTLVVSGDEASIAPGKIKGVKSVESEGTVHIQDPKP